MTTGPRPRTGRLIDTTATRAQGRGIRVFGPTWVGRIS